MSRICAVTGKKNRMQKSGRHASGKSRGGKKAFAYRGPWGLRGKKHPKKQNVNFVAIKTPEGKVLVSMKAYKTYFKTEWTPAEVAA